MIKMVISIWMVPLTVPVAEDEAVGAAVVPTRILQLGEMYRWVEVSTGALLVEAFLEALASNRPSCAAWLEEMLGLGTPEVDSELQAPSMRLPVEGRGGEVDMTKLEFEDCERAKLHQIETVELAIS